MRYNVFLLPAALCVGASAVPYTAISLSQTAVALPQSVEDFVNKNIEAKGGLEKIKAIKTLHMTGKAVFPGGFTGAAGQENMRPNLVRETFTVQGMTQVQAYDGTAGWTIQPFGGKKDPQLLGEDDLRDLLIASDFDGPLIDYKAKGNTIEYLGHDTVDGDDAVLLKVTVKNQDIVYYYLDPDTFLEIRKETQEFIRGSVKETVTQMGSYKPVAGVMYPFSIVSGPKNDPTQWQTLTIEKMEANVPLDSSDFVLPATLRKEQPTK